VFVQRRRLGSLRLSWSFGFVRLALVASIAVVVVMRVAACATSVCHGACQGDGGLRTAVRTDCKQCQTADCCNVDAECVA
jgi:hypothetical protein